MQLDTNEIMHLARAAGKAILAVYERDFSVVGKSDDSPLTEADIASHQCIVAGLAALTPEIPVLSEESAKIPFSTRATWKCYWLVDPLDGTKEFVNRNGEFTVNIALVENGVPILGVVHVPVTNVTYVGRAGVEAFRENANGTRESLHVTDTRQSPLRIAGSRSHAGDSLKAFLDNVGVYELVSLGSSLKLCLVAEGKADIYPRLGPTSEWDTAAAQAVVEAAGGRVTDTRMQPLRYNTKESLLNPFFLVFGDKQQDWSGYLPADVK